jgi:hypothetical protein
MPNQRTLGVTALLGSLSVAVCMSTGCAVDDFSYTGDNAGQGPPGSGSSGSSSGGIDNFGDGASGFGDDAGVGFSAIRPNFGSTVVAAVPPPPISGGTLLVTADGSRAIAADPDRDLVYGVLLSTGAVAYTVTLQSGDEPGRLVEDGAGRVHVALRTGGALVTIDEATGKILTRRAVCPAPRGVAWDSTTDDVWVACATGELVALPASGGAAVQTLTVERDLRDVIVQSGGLSISEFRTAQVLRMGSGATIARRDQLPTPLDGFIPHVAWRAVAGPSETVVAVHQASSMSSVPTQTPSAYGGGCGPVPDLPPPGPPSLGDVDAGALVDAGGAVTDASPDAPEAGPGESAFNDAGCGMPVAQAPPDAGCSPAVVQGVLSIVASSGQVLLNQTIPAALPVDVAVARDGSKIAVAATGNAFVQTLPTVFVLDPCGGTQTTTQTVTSAGTSAQPTAVAFDASGNLIVQTREPAALYVYGPKTTVIALASTTRKDTGHDIFNTQAGAMIACASCHPEGRDDGHVWVLDGNSRRTPSIRGTIAGTAPYHWPGDKPNFGALANDVYTQRMDGALLASDQLSALQGWVEKVPAPPAPSWIDPNAAQRGRTLFATPSVGCSTCHSGAKFTNNLTVDVGTGGSFQVPPLVGVGWRTPLLHDGCAATIADRFGKCATPQHGNIGSLTSQNISDLTAYLETL